MKTALMWARYGVLLISEGVKITALSKRFSTNLVPFESPSKALSDGTEFVANGVDVSRIWRASLWFPKAAEIRESNINFLITIPSRASAHRGPPVCNFEMILCSSHSNWAEFLYRGSSADCSSRKSSADGVFVSFCYILFWVFPKVTLRVDWIPGWWRMPNAPCAREM